MKLLLYFCNIMLFKISLALHCSKYCKDYQKYFEAKSKTSIFSTLVETSKQYDAQSITVLEGLDPVRKRPGMYIGSTGQKGLHHLVFEVVDNSIDEALAGYCTNITIQLNEDGSVMVEDNGRGIPCSLHPKTNKSALETVLCVLHAGGKFGGDSSGYKVSGGLHGVGISVVNALSEKMTVEVARDGNLHTLNLAKGVPLSSLKIEPLSAVSNSMIRGTRIVFKPDPIIFKTSLEFEYEKLANRIDELAYLNPGVTMTMIDNRKYIQSEIRNTEEDSMDTNQQSKLNLRNPRTQVFRHDGGIDELVKFLCQDKVNLHPELDAISINEEIKGVAIEISMRWSKDMYTDNIIGFANGIRTIDGGSHLDGLKAAITKTLNSCAKKTGKLKDSSNSIPGEFLREGLTAVVSAKVPEPEFEGQTKTRLGNPEIRQIVDQIVSRALETIFEWNPQTFNVIFSKAVDAQNAAIAAKAARDMVRKKSLLQSTILPGKLADCSSRDPAECEIYIVEGDSAAGSAKQGRDRKTQAILPLRGKILNIEKASNEKVSQVIHPWMLYFSDKFLDISKWRNSSAYFCIRAWSSWEYFRFYTIEIS